MPKLYTSTFVMKNIQNVSFLNVEIKRSNYCEKKVSPQMGNKLFDQCI